MFLRIVGISSLVTLTLVLLAKPLHAQNKPDWEEGEAKFKEKASATRLVLQRLNRGTEQADPKNKEHQEAIAFGAAYFTYMLHWKADSRKAGDINKIVEGFDKELAGFTKISQKTATMQQMLCRAVTDQAAEVIEKAIPIAAVNAARVLSLITERRNERGFLQTEKDWASDLQPRLAEGNGEHLAEVCLKILASEKANKGVRYYLFRCMAGLVATPAAALKPDTRDRLVEAAIRQIETKGEYPRDTPRSTIEGYKVLRQQAVAVLANARVPATGKEKPVVVLARVAGNDGRFVPRQGWTSAWRQRLDWPG